MFNEKIADSIERYLVENRLSRGQFAAKIGISESLLNKVISGQRIASPRTLLKISAKTGMQLGTIERKFQFDLNDYQQNDVKYLEGSFQTIRPSFNMHGHIHCFETLVQWDAAANCLIFCEIGNKQSPQNMGYVSVSGSQKIIYFICVQKGNFRVAALSDAYEPGLFYGGLLTVASKTMASKIPAASLFVIRKVTSSDDIVRDTISQNHERFSEFDTLLRFTQSEGFFDFFGK
jgi:transcriptional regulator with XRE-family HTH domain